MVCPPTKQDLAKHLGLSRSSLYYHPKKAAADQQLKYQIKHVLHQHPAYGHRRIAIYLKLNKKKIIRVMRKFGLKPYRRRGRKWRKTRDFGSIYPNLLQLLPFPKSGQKIWVSDFTRIAWKGMVVYLATVMDIFDRKVVGWSLLTTHAVQLTLLAFIDALEKHGRPVILHSDQGSEYKSKTYTDFVEGTGTKLSMSHKHSPWENGYQESFYSQFKVDLGDPNRFKTLGELAVAIYLQIHYYNTTRIHTKLKMPPTTYAAQQDIINQLNPRLPVHNLS